MNKILKTIARIAFMLSLIWTLNAQAVQLFDSSAGPVDINSVQINYINGPLYASFSTGGSSYTLNNVTLGLNNGSLTNTGSFSIDLYSDDPGNPNNPDILSPLLHIASVLDSTIRQYDRLYNFPVSDYVLDPNTRYWIGLTSLGVPTTPSDTQVFWNATLNTSGLGVAGEYIYLTGDAAGSYAIADVGVAFLMQIGPPVYIPPDPVPEPAPLAFMLIGLLVVWGMQLRRKLSWSIV